MDERKIDQDCRDQIHNFVARFKPNSEVVLEGDYPYLSASFNDQNGKRHVIKMQDGEFFEKIG